MRNLETGDVWSTFATGLLINNANGNAIKCNILLKMFESDMSIANK